MMFFLIENENDRSKVERLYLNNKSLMMYTAYKVLHDKSLAEDAVQQAFIRVIENLHKVDENNCHKTQGFLVVICRNVACDIYKSKTYLNNEDMTDELTDSTYDPIEIVLNEETFNQIIVEVNKIKPIYQDVLILKYSHDCSNRDIASLLRISENVVRKRLERAKAQLAIALRKEELL